MEQKENRKCNNCQTVKPLNDFSKDKSRKDGIRADCKKCNVERATSLSRTQNGLVGKIYSHQKKSSEKRCHHLPLYTLDELKAWVFSQANFYRLYDAWVDSGYNTELRPSIDRLDDYVGYSFDNIRLTTWENNKAKCYMDTKNGLNNKQNKAVRQYTKDMVFIAEYYSIAEASRRVGVVRSCIYRVASGLRKHCKNFIWEYV